jgi:hypothetical protein
MSEAVLVAAISGFAVMGAAGFAFLGVLVQRGNTHARRASRDAARARVQLENDHTTNLREEGDERHAENGSKLDQLIRDMGGIRSDIRRLSRRDDTLSDRLDTLSDTIPKGSPLWPTTPPQTPPPASMPVSDPSALSDKASRSTSPSPWAPVPPPLSRPSTETTSSPAPHGSP